jgi:hypothetical protein
MSAVNARDREHPSGALSMKRSTTRYLHGLTSREGCRRVHFSRDHTSNRPGLRPRPETSDSESVDSHGNSQGSRGRHFSPGEFRVQDGTMRSGRWSTRANHFAGINVNALFSAKRVVTPRPAGGWSRAWHIHPVPRPHPFYPGGKRCLGHRLIHVRVSRLTPRPPLGVKPGPEEATRRYRTLMPTYLAPCYCQ